VGETDKGAGQTTGQDAGGLVLAFFVLLWALVMV
jgi:hypothetical protein